MNENVLQTLQQFIQDVLAPDVLELKSRAGALEKQMEFQYNALRDQISPQQSQQDMQFRAIMAAIGEPRAQSSLDTFKLIAGLSERMAALEAARH